MHEPFSVPLVKDSCVDLRAEAVHEIRDDRIEEPTGRILPRRFIVHLRNQLPWSAHTSGRALDEYKAALAVLVRYWRMGPQPADRRALEKHKRTRLCVGAESSEAARRADELLDWRRARGRPNRQLRWRAVSMNAQKVRAAVALPKDALFKKSDGWCEEI